MFALIKEISDKVGWVELYPNSSVFIEIRIALSKLENDLTLYMKHVEANEALLLADMPLEIEEL